MHYGFLRKCLFAFEPETAHKLALAGLKLRAFFFNGSIPNNYPIKCMGLEFPNRVGLAAGLDKDAQHISALGSLGFGHIEVGTVTPKPQQGNPLPRVFRLPSKHAVINRMGFNSIGAEAVVENLRQRRYQGVLGINIGKNKDTPNENAIEDYLFCLEKVYPYADYISINLSSPNTPGLRDLQQGQYFSELLSTLKSAQVKLAQEHRTYKPIAVKVAPDLTSEEIKNISEQLLAYKIDGLIATNTTLDKTSVVGLPFGQEAGGLSGAPLKKQSTEVIKAFYQQLRGRIPIIGVGGIFSIADAKEKIQAGASLVQIYTGFIYQGPNLVQKISKFNF